MNSNPSDHGNAGCFFFLALASLLPLCGAVSLAMHSWWPLVGCCALYTLLCIVFVLIFLFG